MLQIKDERKDEVCEIQAIRGSSCVTAVAKAGMTPPCSAVGDLISFATNLDPRSLTFVSFIVLCSSDLQ